MVRPRLLRLARSAARGTPLDPEELAGVVLASIYCNAAGFRFRGSEAFRAWLSTIVRNRVRKEIRSGAFRFLSLAGIPEMDDGGRGDPARLVLEREERETTMRALLLVALLCLEGTMGLEGSARQALVWHHAEGKTFREIARRVGGSPERVAGMVRRGREKVSRHLYRILGPF